MLRRNITLMIAHGLNACGSTVTYNICTRRDEWLCVRLRMRVYVCCLYQGPFEAMAMVNTRIYVYLMQWDAAYATFWYDQDDYTESFPCLLTVCFGKAPWFSLSFFPLKTSFFDRIIQCSCLAPVVEAHFEHVQISIVTSIDKNCQFNDLKLDMQSHMTYKYLR